MGRRVDKYTDFYVLSTEEIEFLKAMVYPLSARPNLIPLGGHCNQSLEHSLAKPSLLASRTLPFLSQAVIQWICSKQDYWRSEIFYLVILLDRLRNGLPVYRNSICALLIQKYILTLFRSQISVFFWLAAIWPLSINYVSSSLSSSMKMSVLCRNSRK